MSTMRLFVSQEGVIDAMKCMAVAALSKADVKPVPMNPGECVWHPTQAWNRKRQWERAAQGEKVRAFPRACLIDL